MLKFAIMLLTVCLGNWSRRFYIEDLIKACNDALYDNEYDNDIPEKAVILPPDTYSTVKELMKTFLKETKTFIEERIEQGDFELQVGHHYYDGYIYTITEIGETRAKYNLFRLEEENISPYWTGDGNIDSLIDYCVPISDDVYKEVRQRYDEFVLGLRTRLYT